MWVPRKRSRQLWWSNTSPFFLLFVMPMYSCYHCVSIIISLPGYRTWIGHSKVGKCNAELHIMLPVFIFCGSLHLPWNSNCALLCLVAQLYLTLCDPMDCSLLGSSDSPGQNNGVGCHALLQGIFPAQVLNPGLPHCRQILYCLSHEGSPKTVTKYIKIYNFPYIGLVKKSCSFLKISPY